MIGPLQTAAAMLLLAAGSGKLVAPRPALLMLRSVWSRSSMREPVVRVAGVLEIAVALAVMVTGDRAAAIAMALCYLAFAAVTVRLLRRGRRSSCGCFGRADSPVGPAHLAVNLTCAAVGMAAAGRPPGWLGALYDHGLLRGVVGTAQAGLLAYLGFLSLTALPALAAARRHLLESR